MTAIIVILFIEGCKPSSRVRHHYEENSLNGRGVISISRRDTPRHLKFKEIPANCLKLGSTARKDFFNSATDHLDCEESCITNIRLPEFCESNDYSSLNELEQQISWKTVRLGGYVFQSNGEQPCSMKKKRCCNSCAEYVVLTDFEDQEDWFKCKRVLMNENEKVVLDLFSMEGSCCTLNDLRFPAIITGKVEKRKEQWYFSEIQSICRIP